MIEVVKKGDMVVMVGGLIGKVMCVVDIEVMVELVDGVWVCVLKGMIVDVWDKNIFVVVND